MEIRSGVRVNSHRSNEEREREREIVPCRFNIVDYYYLESAEHRFGGYCTACMHYRQVNGYLICDTNSRDDGCYEVIYKQVYFILFYIVRALKTTLMTLFFHARCHSLRLARYI